MQQVRHAHMWRSEDTFVGSVLSYRGSRQSTQAARFVQQVPVPAEPWGTHQMSKHLGEYLRPKWHLDLVPRGKDRSGLQKLGREREEPLAGLYRQSPK